MFITCRHSTILPTPEAQKQCFCIQENVCTNVLYYFNPDHVGSSTFLSDENGMPYQFLLYLPFGETMAEQKAGGFGDRYKFNGKEQDALSGLYDYGVTVDGTPRNSEERTSTVSSNVLVNENYNQGN